MNINSYIEIIKNIYIFINLIIFYNVYIEAYHNLFMASSC